jgi:hypothetical protein
MDVPLAAHIVNEIGRLDPAESDFLGHVLMSGRADLISSGASAEDLRRCVGVACAILLEPAIDVAHGVVGTLGPAIKDSLDGLSAGPLSEFDPLSATAAASLSAPAALRMCSKLGAILSHIDEGQTGGAKLGTDLFLQSQKAIARGQGNHILQATANLLRVLKPALSHTADKWIGDWRWSVEETSCNSTVFQSEPIAPQQASSPPTSPNSVISETASTGAMVSKALESVKLALEENIKLEKLLRCDCFCYNLCVILNL